MKTQALLLIILLAVPGALAATEHQVFVSDPAQDASAPRYGYDYTTSNFVQTVADHYTIRGDENSFHGGGVGLEGKMSYRASYEISATSDGFASKFFVFFSTHDSNANSAAWGSEATGPAFQNGYKFWMHENGGSWVIHLDQVINGGLETLTTASVGDPNNDHLFGFEVNAHTGEMTITRDGVELATTNADADLWAPLFSHWIVGYAGGLTDTSTFIGHPAGATVESTRIYDTDPQPPTFSDLDWVPTVLAANETLQITVTAVDDWDSTLAVELHYTVDGGATQTVAMARSGDSYSGGIPAQPADTVLRFWLDTTDSSDKISRTNTYRFDVGSGDPVVDEGGATGDDNPIIQGTETSASRQSLIIILAGIVAAAFGLFVFQKLGYKRTGVTIMIAAILGAGLALVYVSVDVNGAFASIPPIAWIGTGIVLLGGLAWRFLK